jgi:hypothetical protein
MGFQSRKNGDRGTLPYRKANRHRSRVDKPKNVKPRALKAELARPPQKWAQLLRGHDYIQLFILRAFQ